jgi:SPP1 gp7 family putative phage head morphogenesis protein
MSTANELYWLRRSLANSSKAFNTAEIKLALLKKQYEKAKQQLDREVKAYYQRAGVQPTGTTQQEQLLAQVQLKLQELAEAEEMLLQQTLAKTYQQGYYRSIYEVQRKIGMGVDFALLPARAIEQAVNTAWSGESYSARIWKRRKKLGKAVSEIISTGIAIGDTNDKMAAKLADLMDSSFNRAKRLVRTETAYVYNAASMKGYEAAGLDQYQFIATLDMRTSNLCQQIDNKVFYLKDAQVGKNMPPLHPNCRSTTIPFFDEDELRQRIARGLDGRNYKVPANMSYDTWYQQHVEAKHSKLEIQAAKKADTNRVADQQQLLKLQKQLGKQAPKTLAKFQQIKYTDQAAWSSLKKLARNRSKSGNKT